MWLIGFCDYFVIVPMEVRGSDNAWIFKSTSFITSWLLETDYVASATALTWHHRRKLRVKPPSVHCTIAKVDDAVAVAKVSVTRQHFCGHANVSRSSWKPFLVWSSRRTNSTNLFWHSWYIMRSAKTAHEVFAYSYFRVYRARQKNGSQVERIFQARPGRSGKQQQEQNSRNLGTVFFAGPCMCSDSLTL